MSFCVCVNSVCPVLQSNSSFQELVLVENTRLSEQYFSAVQKFVVFDLGLTLLPVSGQTEASQLITQIVSNQDKTINLQSIPVWFGDTFKCADFSSLKAFVEYLCFSQSSVPLCYCNVLCLTFLGFIVFTVWKSPVLLTQPAGVELTVIIQSWCDPSQTL